MTNIEGKKSPQLRMFGLVLYRGSLLFTLIGYTFLFDHFFIDDISLFISPETKRDILIWLFFVFSGLSLTNTGWIMIQIGNNCVAFFLSADKEKNHRVLLMKMYSSAIFCTVVSLLLLMFIKPYNDVLPIILGICCCINIWCYAIISFYRNTALQSLSSTE